MDEELNYRRYQYKDRLPVKGVFLQMLKQKAWLLIFLIPIVLVCASCDRDREEPVERIPESTSEGGALLETGYELDDDNRIVEPQNNFNVNEDFYFSFYNNGSFGVDRVTVELINRDTDEVAAENSYQVDPEWDTVFDMIWFGQPGMYRIAVEVGGRVRASQEVIIE